MGTKQYDSATDLITFSRASGGTFLGSNGLLQTAANNVPRIEYDATGAAKGLLIEEDRTNIAKYSQDFSNHYWNAFSARGPMVANATTAPDGTTTADKIMAENADTTNGAFQNATPVPTSGCVSVFAKADTVDWLGFGEAGDCWAYFDLANGVTGNKSTTIGSTSITAYPNGWYLCEAYDITTSWSRVLFSPKPTEGNGDPWSNVTNAIGDSVFLWGAQIEAGAFPTSYIPTTSAAATRVRDLAEIPTSAFGYNNDAGSVAVEFKSNKPSNQFYGAFALNDNTDNNRIVHHTFNIGQHRGAVVTSGSLDVDLTAGSRGAPSELVKFAIGFSDNNFAASLNGATAVVDTSVTIPSGISKLGIGFMFQQDLNSNLLNGHIKSIQYYPRQLTNTQLQELTT